MRQLFPILILCALVPTHAQTPHEIKKTIADELALLVEQKLNKPAMAKQLKLQFPVTAPTMTEEDIQAKLDVATQKELATYTNKSREEIAAAARERYPLYQIGDEVVMTNRRGQTLRGTLRENSPRFLRLDDRLYPKVDITDQSLLAVDEERNKAVVDRYISNKLSIQKDREKSTRDVLDGTLGTKLRYAAGYARYRGRWMTAEALFERALTWKREQLAKQYREEVTARVYGRFGYTLEEGQWVPPAEGVATAIVATDQQEDFFAAPPTTPPTTPPAPAASTEPLVAPPAPVKQPKARDTVLAALKDQGAVENLPASASAIGTQPEAEPVRSKPEPQVFGDHSKGAKAIDFANTKSSDVQLAALHARVDALRPARSSGGGAASLVELTLACMAALAATHGIKSRSDSDVALARALCSGPDL